MCAKVGFTFSLGDMESGGSQACSASLSITENSKFKKFQNEKEIQDQKLAHRFLKNLPKKKIEDSSTKVL